MYIAMNRFKVLPGAEAEFEEVWRSRDSRLGEMPGFVEFHLLKGPTSDDHTPYASHTVWKTYEACENWTKSVQFRAAHGRTGSSKPLTTGHPNFEGFHVVDDVA